MNKGRTDLNIGKRLAIGLKVLTTIAAFLSAATLGLSKLPDKPDPTTGQPPSASPFLGVAQSDWLYWSVVASITLAALVLIDAAWTLAKERKQTRFEAVRENVSFFLLGALKFISDKTGINIIYLGGSVFEYKKKGKSFRLESLVRYRFDAYPPPSGIEWTSGKGAIGAAAATREAAHCDWVALSTQLNRSPESKTELLTAVPDSARYGFTDDELARMGKRYYESLAVPILADDGEKLLGVLAIDIPNRNELDLANSLLGDKQSEQIATGAAAFVAKALGSR